MGDTLGIVSLYSHAWEWTISTNGLMTVRASSAHGTGKKKKRTMICFDGIVDVELDGICFAWYKAQEELVAE